ncbi:MAG: sulfatase [Acidimicrobiia bacterium]|nr:sulfatase [Acidimicrobiia bacterium]
MGAGQRIVAVVLTITLCAPLAVAPARAVAEAPAPKRPNFVVFLVDDLDALTSPYWEALPKTRALIADRGMTFANAFAPTPICCPARATTLTGEYGHNTGVLTNAGPHGGWPAFMARDGEQRTFPLALQQAGYNTMLAGKYMNEVDPTHVPPGWTEYYGGATDRIEGGYNYFLNENGTLVWYGQKPEDYEADVVARHTVDFVTRAAADTDTPFFAYVTPTAPHLPQPPAPRYQNHPWRYADPPQNPNFFEADLSDKPWWLRASGAVRSAWRAWNVIDYRNRMGSLLAVDDLVADTVTALDAAGALDDTYLIFASDNGYNLGAHRLVHKMAPYEESLRVPFVVAGPGVAHATDDHPVLLTDVAPTLLDLAGVAIPGHVDGRSFAHLLRGDDPGTWRDAFPIQYASAGLTAGLGTDWPPFAYLLVMIVLVGADVPSYRGVHTDRYVYIEWYDRELFGRHEYELYDLEADPWQLDNLLATPAGRVANAAIVADLDARMDTLTACHGVTCRDAGG